MENPAINNKRGILDGSRLKMKARANIKNCGKTLKKGDTRSQTASKHSTARCFNDQQPFARSSIQVKVRMAHKDNIICYGFTTNLSEFYR